MDSRNQTLLLLSSFGTMSAMPLYAKLRQRKVSKLLNNLITDTMYVFFLGNTVISGGVLTENGCRVHSPRLTNKRQSLLVLVLSETYSPAFN